MTPNATRGVGHQRIAFALLIVAISLVACGGDPTVAAWKKAGLPEWLPPYPGTEPVLLSENLSGSDLVGMASFTVGADPKASGKLYEELLSAAGFKVRLFPFDTPGGRTWRLEGDNEADTRGIYLNISPTDSGSNFVLNYSETQ